MAIDFEVGSSQWIDQGDDLPALNAKTAACIMAWVKLESAAATMGICSMSIGPPPGSSAASRMTLEVRSTRAIQIVVRALDTDSSLSLLSTGLLTLGVRHHVAGVVDIANDIFEVYIDGVLDASSSPAFTPTAFDTTNAKNSAIAARPDGSSEFLDGVLEDTRLYSRRVLAAEIATMHATRGIDGIVHGLEGRFLLNEGHDGKTVTGAGSIKDLSAGQMNGDPNASPVYAAGVLRTRRKVA